MVVRSAESVSTKHVTYFRLGKLRVGFHGVLGGICAMVTTAALFRADDSVLLFLSVLLSTVLALDALQLLDQVPVKTKIADWIVAPHREAFQRTVSMVVYVNIRICGQSEWIPEWLTAGYWILLVGCWFLFLPLHCSVSNGNTWVFVVPMFLGVTMDIAQHYLAHHSGDWVSNHEAVGSVGCCAVGLISVRTLLMTQLSALLIAFLFTLAFRSYADIRGVYFASAAVVSMLLVQAISSISTAL